MARSRYGLRKLPDAMLTATRQLYGSWFGLKSLLTCEAPPASRNRHRVTRLLFRPIPGVPGINLAPVRSPPGTQSRVHGDGDERTRSQRRPGRQPPPGAGMHDLG